MYREKDWEKGYYLVNLMKLRCCECQREFIVGKEMCEGLPLEFPICPYCGSINLDLIAWTEDSDLAEKACDLGCLALEIMTDEI